MVHYGGETMDWLVSLSDDTLNAAEVSASAEPDVDGQKLTSVETGASA